MKSEIERKVRAEAKDTSAAAAKDRWHLSNARAITQVVVLRLIEEQLRIYGENAARVEIRAIKKKAADKNLLPPLQVQYSVGGRPL